MKKAQTPLKKPTKRKRRTKKEIAECLQSEIEIRELKRLIEQNENILRLDRLEKFMPFKPFNL